MVLVQSQTRAKPALPTGGQGSRVTQFKPTARRRRGYSWRREQKEEESGATAS